MGNKVVIDKTRLHELLDMEERLSALENGGVDCWSGYDIAMEG